VLLPPIYLDYTGVGWEKSLLLDSVIFPIIGALITLVVAILNWATSKRETEKWDKRAYQYAVLLAAAFTAYGTWRAFVLSEEKTWQQADVQFQNEWLQRKQLKERLQYERELRAKTGELAKKSDELSKKSDAIAHLNRELKNSVIGGDSFCYLALSFFSDTDATNFGELVVVHQGKYHLYDVHARIFDLDKSDEVESRGITLETMKLTNTNIAIGNLLPGHTRKIAQMNLGNATERRFNIFFNARNGDFTQVLRFRKVGGRWQHATKVDRGKDLPPFEEITPGYPRNNKGQVDW
jgi:hypothetical protein